ncbi:MAG: hypothetical protein AABZ11_10400 [Nitrospinota bacterium]
MNWKRGIGSGMAAGIVWGFAAMAVNAITGVFPVEHDLLHNITAFTTGGAIFGIVTGGLLTLIHDRLPFRTFVSNAVLITTFIWLILRIGGFLLSSVNPMRYHAELPATIQGFTLAVLMGGILGIVCQIWQKSEPA